MLSIRQGRDSSTIEALNAVALRAVQESDLDTFFVQQTDQDAIQIAAFAADDPGDRAAFNARWRLILDSEAITKMTIVYDGKVAGHVMAYELFAKPEICYWLGKEFWGKGIATAGLKDFLTVVRVRPLYARAARDNIGSIRVLEKAGFEIYGCKKGFANARGAEIEAVTMLLT
jgi:RimJ/RimL family protein N-acetyltransferase